MSPPPGIVVCFNRQRTRRVDSARLVDLTRRLLGRLGRTAEIAIHLVGPVEMERLNRAYLDHEGSTDIITFDHGSGGGHLHGELFICIADAVAQAARFGIPWTEELGRYVAHGLLHLDGHDDREPDVRRVMKRHENALVRWMRSNGGTAVLERIPARPAGKRSSRKT